jgi:hypothetical protein
MLESLVFFFVWTAIGSGEYNWNRYIFTSVPIFNDRIADQQKWEPIRYIALPAAFYVLDFLYYTELHLNGA